MATFSSETKKMQTSRNDLQRFKYWEDVTVRFAIARKHSPFIELPYKLLSNYLSSVIISERSCPNNTQIENKQEVFIKDLVAIYLCDFVLLSYITAS